jgi:hypothetical protein
MRATERLLELIADEIELLALNSIESSETLAISAAVAELRRRGDTIVQARDLVLLLDVARHGLDAYPDALEATEATIVRIEDAIGGVL